MQQIDKNNYKQFINCYSGFHDAYVKELKYDTEQLKIVITFDVWTTGTPILYDHGKYDEAQAKLKMIFEKVHDFSENNPYKKNYIDYAYIDFFNNNGDRTICFSLYGEAPDEEPYLYITCENIEYEEIK